MDPQHPRMLTTTKSPFFVTVMDSEKFQAHAFLDTETSFLFDHKLLLLLLGNMN